MPKPPSKRPPRKVTTNWMEKQAEKYKQRIQQEEQERGQIGRAERTLQTAEYKPHRAYITKLVDIDGDKVASKRSAYYRVEIYMTVITDEIHPRPLRYQLQVTTMSTNRTTTQNFSTLDQLADTLDQIWRVNLSEGGWNIYYV